MTAAGGGQVVPYEKNQDRVKELGRHEVNLAVDIL